MTPPTPFLRLLSTLAEPGAARTAARMLGGACGTGYALTLLIMTASGGGPRSWFFALLVWGALVYVPLRILLEALQTVAPGARARLIARTAVRRDRYGGRASIGLVVDGLAARAVIMPRIATPGQQAKAKEGAVAILARTRGADGELERAAVRCLAAVEQWVLQLASWAAAHAAENVQARWTDVRGLAGLAALTRILIAAYEDRTGRGFAVGSLHGDAAASYLDTCLDFCDQLALEVDVAPWGEPGLRLDVTAGIREATQAAWKAFSGIPSPAVDARNAFVNTVLRATQDP